MKRYMGFLGGLLGVSLWACGALAIEPGNQFSVHISWPLMLDEQQVYEPSRVNFNVIGCDDFTLEGVLQSSASVSKGAKAVTAPLEFVPSDHGGYAAPVDLAELLQESACITDETEPDDGELQLAVTCKGDGRVTHSNSIPVRYAIAAKHISMWKQVDQLFSLDDPNRFLAISDAGLQIYHADAAESWAAWQTHPVGISHDSQHQFVRHGNIGYLSSRCLLPKCDSVTVVDPQTRQSTVVTTTHLYILDFHPWHPGEPEQFVTDMITVPGQVVQMAVDNDGSVVFLSQEETAPWSGGALGGTSNDPDAALIVTRLRDRRLTTEQVLPQQHPHRNVLFGRDLPPSPFYATTSSADSEHFYLRSLFYRQPQRIDLSGSGRLLAISLAPDGQDWGVTREQEVWLGGLGKNNQRLLLAEGDGPFAQLVWTANAVAVKNMQSWRTRPDGSVIGAGVSLYERAAGHHLLSSWSEAVYSWASASGNLIVHDEIWPGKSQIVDARGNRVGGFRIPRQCGFTTFLTETAPNQIAVVSSGSLYNSIYLLDMNRYGLAKPTQQSDTASGLGTPQSMVADGGM